jgi:hypothetical protein
LRISLIGFAPRFVENVLVCAGLTTAVDALMDLTMMDMDGVVVVAPRRGVDPDVSAKLVKLTASSSQSPTVVSINEAIELQGGIVSNTRNHAICPFGARRPALLCKSNCSPGMSLRGTASLPLRYSASTTGQG